MMPATGAALWPGAGAGVTVWCWLHIAVFAAAASGVGRKDWPGIDVRGVIYLCI